MEIYACDSEFAENMFGNRVRLREQIVVQVESDVNLAVVGAICFIVEILLVEEVISAVTHPLGYAIAFVVKRLRGIAHTGANNMPARVVRNIVEHRVFEVDGVVADGIFRA